MIFTYIIIDIQDLVKNQAEQQHMITQMKQKISRLSKKTLKDYIPISQELLVKKCLQFGGTSHTVFKLAETILLDENYDDAAVAALSGMISKQIDAHLNNTKEAGCRTWTRKYLMTLKSQHKGFAGNLREFTKMVDDLLRFSSV